MTAQTPGQAAYEAMHASREERGGEFDGGHVPWTQLDESMAGDFGALKREDMERAAQAAIDADGSRALLAQVRAIVFRSDTQQARIRELVELLDGGTAAPAAPQPAPGEVCRHDFSCHADDRVHAEDCECWCHGDPRPQQPQPAPELAAAIAETRRYRDGIERLINALRSSASSTHPSKKSEIEFSLLRKLKTILDGQ